MIKIIESEDYNVCKKTIDLISNIIKAGLVGLKE
jgi:hypothetical protein